jgi:hypothetical protein
MESQIDYDQVANYEAALELMNTLRGIFLSLAKSDKKYHKALKVRAFEIGKEKQQLEPTHDRAVANIRSTYAPLVQSYYNNPKEFRLTKTFLTTKAENV